MKNSNRSLWTLMLASVLLTFSVGAAPTKIAPVQPAVIQKSVPIKRFPALKEAPKVLVILSDASVLTLKNRKKVLTGYFLNELVIPLMVLTQAGYSVVFATPTGKAPTMDKRSDDPKYFANAKEYKMAKTEMKNFFAIRNPLSFKTVMDLQLEGYKGVLIPGGHAPLMDLFQNPTLGKILTSFHSARKPTGLICHGPAALLSAVPSDKKQASLWPYRGYKMTVFSQTEEHSVETSLGGVMPFYADSELTQVGALLVQGTPGASNVVRDRELVTGQNPASVRSFGDAFVAALKGK